MSFLPLRFVVSFQCFFVQDTPKKFVRSRFCFQTGFVTRTSRSVSTATRWQELRLFWPTDLCRESERELCPKQLLIYNSDFIPMLTSRPCHSVVVLCEHFDFLTCVVLWCLWLFCSRKIQFMICLHQGLHCCPEQPETSRGWSSLYFDPLACSKRSDQNKRNKLFKHCVELSLRL